MLASIARSLRHTSLALCVAFALLLASAGVPVLAHAELASNSLTELANKAQQEEEAKTTATTPANGKQETSSSGIPTSIAVLGAGAMLALLGGIAFVIIRDARSVAPVAESAAGPVGGSRHSEAHMRKRRAKAKAARQQRKRNR